MDVVNFLSQKIKSPAEVIQFAKDGKYEESWIIALGEEPPSKEDISKYVNKESYGKLIVEYIWNLEDDASRFVLTVIQDKNCIVQSGTDFIEICLDVFYLKEDFLPFIGEINNRIIGQNFLFQSPVEIVRMGIFNHWFSTNPIDLWKAGEELKRESIFAKIKERPEIKRTNLNYQGLAFIYNFNGSLAGPYHILKTPCCKKTGEDWTVDSTLSYFYMEQLIGKDPEENAPTV